MGTTPGGAALWLADPTDPWIPHGIADALRLRAEQSGAAPALHVADAGGTIRTLTFAELYAEASRVARGLLTLVEPGSAVAVCAANSVEWVLCEYACALAGVLLVPVNPAMADPELAHILAANRVEVVLTAPAHRGRPLAGRLRAITAAGRPVQVLDLAGWTADADGPALPPVDAGPDRPFLVQYTSGTTGRPKGAVHTQASALNSGARWCADWGQSPSDVLAAPVPLHHVGASINVLLGCLATGSAAALLSDYDPAVFVRLIDGTRATVLAAVPTMLFDLLRQPGFDAERLAAVHTVVGGGSAVPATTVRAVEETFGVRFVVSYGQSESPAILQTRPDDAVERKATTLGRPLPCRDVRITRDDGSTAPFGGIGEICTRSRIRMTGYLGQPDATAEVIDTDGWLHTGDLGAMDADGYVTFHGRAREVIIRGGENLYPLEIEAVLQEHPAVAAVAVVAGSDPRWGEVPVAFVVPAAGRAVSAAELEEFGRARLASFKIPRRWIEVAAMPLTASGKIRKVELRDRLRGAPADAAPEPRTV